MRTLWVIHRRCMNARRSRDLVPRRRRFPRLLRVRRQLAHPPEDGSFTLSPTRTGALRKPERAPGPPGSASRVSLRTRSSGTASRIPSRSILLSNRTTPPTAVPTGWSTSPASSTREATGRFRCEHQVRPGRGVCAVSSRRAVKERQAVGSGRCVASARNDGPKARLHGLLSDLAQGGGVARCFGKAPAPVRLSFVALLNLPLRLLPPEGATGVSAQPI